MGRPKKIGFENSVEKKDAVVEKKQMTKDGWSNAIAGLGTQKDKRKHTKFSSTSVFSKEQLADMYVGDGLISRIIDAKADDLTREWINIPFDTDSIVMDELERLDAQTTFNIAKKFSRLFGGALIFMGIMDGQSTDKPVNFNKVKTIEYLKVYDLGDIDTAGSTFVLDPKRPDYGDIELYKVRVAVGNTFNTVVLHKSRCIPIYGAKLPTSSRSGSFLFETRHWGVSIVPRIWNAIQDFVGAFGSVSSILYEFIIGKYKFADLDEMLAQGNEDRLKIRIEAIDMTKSTINSVLLGTDEDYTRDSASLGGVSDVLDRFMMYVSAVTGYPVTRLFGRSPAGLNATGENDIKNYYDDVRHEQKTMNKCVQALINVVATYTNQQLPVKFVWNTMFQLTEEQLANMNRIKAETYRTQADADQRYIDSGVIVPEQVYKMRFADTLGEDDFTEVDLEPDGPDEPEDLEEEDKKGE